MSGLGGTLRNLLLQILILLTQETWVGAGAHPAPSKNYVT